MMSIIGDAYARPIIDELRRTPYDLTSFQRLATGGATTSEDAKQALFELHPRRHDHRRVRRVGDRRHGVRRDDERQQVGGLCAGRGRGRALRRSHPLPRRPATTRSAGPRAAAACRSAISATAERTEQIFPIVDGERLAVPGDRAQLEADGTIRMLGRDSMVVNTGGEKVFVEEVEIALRQHPDVVDALVVGRASERFGQEVVAVVQLRPGATVSPSELREFVARHHRPVQGAARDRVLRHDRPPSERQARLPVGAPRSGARGERRRPRRRADMDLGVRGHGYIIFGGNPRHRPAHTAAALRGRRRQRRASWAATRSTHRDRRAIARRVHEGSLTAVCGDSASSPHEVGSHAPTLQSSTRSRSRYAGRT